MPRMTVTAIARMNAVRSSRRIAQTAIWQVTELRIRRMVAGHDERERRDLEGVARLRVERWPLHGVRPQAEVGREQPAEEHHLRGDEQEHPEDRVADAAVGVVRHRGERVVLRRDGVGLAAGRYRHRRCPLSARPSGRAGRRRPVAPSGSRGGGRSCRRAAASWSPIRACCPPTGRRRPAPRCAAR